MKRTTIFLGLSLIGPLASSAPFDFWTFQADGYKTDKGHNYVFPHYLRTDSCLKPFLKSEEQAQDQGDIRHITSEAFPVFYFDSLISNEDNMVSKLYMTGSACENEYNFVNAKSRISIGTIRLLQSSLMVEYSGVRDVSMTDEPATNYEKSSPQYPLEELIYNYFVDSEKSYKSPEKIKSDSYQSITEKTIQEAKQSGSEAAYVEELQIRAQNYLSLPYVKRRVGQFEKELAKFRNPAGMAIQYNDQPVNNAGEPWDKLNYFIVLFDKPEQEEKISTADTRGPEELKKMRVMIVKIATPIWDGIIDKFCRENQ
jgi:hypothetical protein